jgi:hypothetical protein
MLTDSAITSGFGWNGLTEGINQIRESTWSPRTIRWTGVNYPDPTAPAPIDVGLTIKPKDFLITINGVAGNLTVLAGDTLSIDAMGKGYTAMRISEIINSVAKNIWTSSVGREHTASDVERGTDSVHAGASTRSYRLRGTQNGVETALQTRTVTIAARQASITINGSETFDIQHGESYDVEWNSEYPETLVRTRQLAPTTEAWSDFSSDSTGMTARQGNAPIHPITVEYELLARGASEVTWVSKDSATVTINPPKARTCSTTILSGSNTAVTNGVWADESPRIQVSFSTTGYPNVEAKRGTTTLWSGFYGATGPYTDTITTAGSHAYSLYTDGEGTDLACGTITSVSHSCSITASPNNIDHGGATTIDWSTDWSGAYVTVNAEVAPHTATQGAFTQNLYNTTAGNTTYTYHVRSSDGVSRCNATVNVTPNRTYAWVATGWGACGGAYSTWGNWNGTWSACTVSCGGGTQTQSRSCNNELNGSQSRTVTCVATTVTGGATAVVADSYCNPATKPTTTQACSRGCEGSNTQSQSCNTQSCYTYEWNRTWWGTCVKEWGGWGTWSAFSNGSSTRSRTCSTKGTKAQTHECWSKSISTGNWVAEVNTSLCTAPKPADSIECTEGSCSGDGSQSISTKLYYRHTNNPDYSEITTAGDPTPDTTKRTVTDSQDVNSSYYIKWEVTQPSGVNEAVSIGVWTGNTGDQKINYTRPVSALLADIPYDYFLKVGGKLAKSVRVTVTPLPEIKEVGRDPAAVPMTMFFAASGSGFAGYYYRGSSEGNYGSYTWAASTSFDGAKINEDVRILESVVRNTKFVDKTYSGSFGASNGTWVVESSNNYKITADISWWHSSHVGSGVIVHWITKLKIEHKSP